MERSDWPRAESNCSRRHLGCKTAIKCATPYPFPHCLFCLTLHWFPKCTFQVRSACLVDAELTRRLCRRSSVPQMRTEEGQVPRRLRRLEGSSARVLLSVCLSRYRRDHVEFLRRRPMPRRAVSAPRPRLKRRSTRHLSIDTASSGLCLSAAAKAALDAVAIKRHLSSYTGLSKPAPVSRCT